MEEINIKQFCMEAQIQYDIWICMNMGILENLLIIRQYSLGDAAQHLFFSCRVSYAMWNRCYLWVVLNSVLHNEANSHFLQHSIWGINKKSNYKWKLTWYAVIWGIWLHRNAIAFNEELLDEGKLWGLIKTRSWLWLKSKVKKLLLFVVYLVNRSDVMSKRNGTVSYVGLQQIYGKVQAWFLLFGSQVFFCLIQVGK